MQNNFVKQFLDWLMNTLKERVVKLALKKILGSAVVAGPKAWLISFAVKNLWNEIAEPLIRAGLVELQYAYEKREGKVLIKRLEKAKEDNDKEEYEDTIDDIYS